MIHTSVCACVCAYMCKRVRVSIHVYVCRYLYAPFIVDPSSIHTYWFLREVNKFFAHPFTDDVILSR